MTHVLVLLPILPIIFITVEVRDNTSVQATCLPLVHRPVLTWRSYADAGGIEIDFQYLQQVSPANANIYQVAILARNGSNWKAIEAKKEDRPRHIIDQPRQIFSGGAKIFCRIKSTFTLNKWDKRIN